MFSSGYNAATGQSMAPSLNASLDASLDTSLNAWFGPAAHSAGLEPNWPAVIAALAAICAVATAIRLMDDLLDSGIDAGSGYVTLAARLQEATLPYALAAFACSAALAPRLAVSLFVASYAIGMVGDHNRPLPLHLRGWQEGMLMLLVGVSGAGVACMAWALAFIASVQAYDDLIDQHVDTQAGIRNLCARYGAVEVALAGLSALILSLMFSPLLTLQGWLALLLIQKAASRSTTQGGLVHG